MIDNDYKTFSREQIDNKVANFKKSLLLILGETLIVYLKYEEGMMKFEDFLKLHSKNQKLFEGYKKTHKSIYEKTMGKNGKNKEQLFANIKVKNKCLEFKQIFEKRKDRLN
ncbi:MAG: hypothetical protein K4H23_01665 [Mollicutes bacterium PWAP]|nr:hypothetical protein [Mollicutes bacterium PWAP]